MGHAKRLDKTSGIFFFLGFVAHKLTYIPVVLVSMTSNILSVALYLIGYILWLIACQIYPDYPALPKHWYAFTQFKNQYKASAILGILAFILGTVGIFFPLCLLPAAWLLALSNIIWCIGEYHKKNHPPRYDPGYSNAHQSLYLAYTITTTSIAIVAAIAATIAFVFPPTTLITLLVSGIVSLFLGALAFNLWVEFSFGKFKPDAENKKEYSLANGSYTTFHNKKLLSTSKEPSPVEKFPASSCTPKWPISEPLNTLSNSPTETMSIKGM